MDYKKLTEAEIQEALKWAEQPLDRVIDADLQKAKVIHVLAAAYERVRKQRDEEAWYHAACLSLAEGVHYDGVIQPSLAMSKIIALIERAEKAEANTKWASERAIKFEKGYLEVSELLEKAEVNFCNMQSRALEFQKGWEKSEAAMKEWKDKSEGAEVALAHSNLLHVEAAKERDRLAKELHEVKYFFVQMQDQAKKAGDRIDELEKELADSKA